MAKIFFYIAMILSSDLYLEGYGETGRKGVQCINERLADYAAKMTDIGAIDSLDGMLKFSDSIDIWENKLNDEENKLQEIIKRYQRYFDGKFDEAEKCLLTIKSQQVQVAEFRKRAKEAIQGYQWVLDGFNAIKTRFVAELQKSGEKFKLGAKQAARPVTLSQSKLPTFFNGGSIHQGVRRECACACGTGSANPQTFRPMQPSYKIPLHCHSLPVGLGSEGRIQPSGQSSSGNQDYYCFFGFPGELGNEGQYSRIQPFGETRGGNQDPTFNLGMQQYRGNNIYSDIDEPW